MTRSGVTLLLAASIVLASCGKRTPLDPNDPSSYIVWCLECADNGTRIYLTLLPDKFYPDPLMEAVHGTWCRAIREEIVKDYEWSPVEIYNDINVPVTFAECYIHGEWVQGWLFTELLRPAADVEPE